jgi:hypothetical protein
MTYRSLESVIRSGVKSESKYMSFKTAVRTIFEKRIEKDYNDQIVVGGYRTFQFDMCPKAQKLYSDLPVDIDRNRAEVAARMLDQLFGLEKGVIATEKATDEDIKQAKTYADRIMDQARMLGLSKEHAFVADHIKTIESYHKTEADKPKTDVTDDDIKKAFNRPPIAPTKEIQDSDIDNQKFRISRNLKAQRKLKIIDND